MTSTEITIRSRGLDLVGTLTTPDPNTGGRIALLVSGSGPIDRDSNMKRLPIGVMGRLADRLSAAGIASLRYDKAGVGSSGGDYLSTGFLDNVADARAALESIRQRGFSSDRIVVIGHSEGALIASELANDRGIAGVVLLAGAARNGREVLEWQASRVTETLPAPARLLLKLLRQDIARTQAKRLALIENSTEDVLRVQMVKLNAKWFREFMSHDPSVALARAQVPVLAITGSNDIQVDPQDIDRMRDLVPSEFTGLVPSNVTHFLREHDGPPTTKAYKKQVTQPLSDQVAGMVVEWVHQQTSDVRGAGQTPA